MQKREPFNGRINVLGKKQRSILQYIFLLITELYCITHVKRCDDLGMLIQRKKTWERKKDKELHLYVFHLKGVQGILRYYILWYSGRLFKYLVSSVFAGRRYPPAIIISWSYEVRTDLRFGFINTEELLFLRNICKVEAGYDDIGLYDFSPMTSDILWYQLIRQCYPLQYIPRLKRHLFTKTVNIFNDVITEIDCNLLN